MAETNVLLMFVRYKNRGGRAGGHACTILYDQDYLINLRKVQNKYRLTTLLTPKPIDQQKENT